MDTAERNWSVFHAAMALLLAGLVAWWLLTNGEAPGYRIAALLLGAAFFGASTPSSVRSHEAYNAASAAFTAAVFGLLYLATGSGVVGVLLALTLVGTLIELYNWRAGTEYLRLG